MFGKIKNEISTEVAGIEHRGRFPVFSDIRLCRVKYSILECDILRLKSLSEIR